MVLQHRVLCPAAHRFASFGAGLCLLIAFSVPNPVLAQAELNIGADLADVLEQIDEILARVGRIRGLEARGPIAAGVHDRESLRQVILEKVAEELSPEDLRTEERLLQWLGVLGPDVDYEALMIEILTSQIAGFYDDDTQELFLIEDTDPLTLTTTLAHELFHGIQDQIFGIRTIRPDWDHADDALLAGTALIEGDATAVMFDYNFNGSMSFTDIPNFMELLHSQVNNLQDLGVGMPDGTPPFLEAQLFFPYIGGMGFIHYIKSAGGWDAVNEVYADPPVSTEHILHPERFLDRDDPTWIGLNLEAIESAGFAVTYDQIFGELQWQALFADRLQDTVSERSLEAASAGWDGDRLITLENEDGDLVVISLSVWDSSVDAAQFEAMLLSHLEQRFECPLTLWNEGEHGDAWSMRVDEHWTAVERWGDMVLLVAGAPDTAAGAYALGWTDAIWRGRVRRGYPSVESSGTR